MGGKREVLMPTARHLYVEMGMTKKAIAQKLCVKETTVASWQRFALSSGDDWDFARKSILGNERKVGSIISNILDAAHEEATKKVRMDVDHLDRLSKIALRFADMKNRPIKSFQDVEDEKVEQEDKKDTGLDENAIKHIEKNILGIDNGV